jgi:sigma-B regulation protein RsbU (phosphoserine phosphatase)
MTSLLSRTRGTDAIRGREPLIPRKGITQALRESQALAAHLAGVVRELEGEAREIGDLQRSLLPDPLPAIPGIDVAASCRPCGHAGGDLYDIFPLDNGPAPDRWCVFIGDATGHGLAAAVVIAMLQSILRAHPSHVRGPADLLAHCNRHLCHRQIPGFVTGVIGIFEVSTRRLTYACAGHPLPLLKFSAENTVSRVEAIASYPLGVDSGTTFGERSIQLRPGDTLLLYTDGITEALNSEDEMFSEERLKVALRDSRDRPSGLIANLQKLVSTHRECRPPTDDQTLVAIAAA